jgi:hypothetical protein
MDEFEVIQQMDYLSELKERIDDRYKPIVEAKINYRLQQIYKEKEDKCLVKKHYIPERFCR